MKRIIPFLILPLAVWIFPLGAEEKPGIPSSEAEWKQRLSPEEYQVLRKKGTERPNSSKLIREKRKGTFVCAGCGHPLFTSSAKYESCTGWPSFYEPMDPSAVGTREDRSHNLVRTEVYCAKCNGHLGHVFPDGPQPTGLRYCMNGVAMKFVPDPEAKAGRQ
ncbi:MAG: peptide-methionine (R)-S-oxide reductase MsrB [Kiritimatiellia bacterium]